MGGPIDFKFPGGILGSTGILAMGLLEMCMIHVHLKSKYYYQKGPKVRSRNKAQHIEDGKICLSLLATDSKVIVYRVLH